MNTHVFTLVLSVLTWRPDAFASTLASSGSSTPGAGQPVIRVVEGRVSVKLRGVPLEAVVTEVAAQSRTRMVMYGFRSERIVADFNSLPIDEALRRLIEENFLLVHDGRGRLVEVWLLSRGQGSQAYAVPVLSQPQDEKQLDAMLEVLREDEDPAVREDAISALEDRGDPSGAAGLAEAALGDSDEGVRQRAVEALARVGHRDAVEVLGTVLREDPGLFVRYEALVALTEIGGSRATELLRDAVDDPHKLIAAKAGEALRAGAFADR